MKNKKRKCPCLFALLLMLSLLSGCRLATDEIAESNDCLIGVFVTTRPLDDVLAEAQRSEGFSLEVESDAVNLNRIYAAKVATEDALISFVFTGLDGIGYFNTVQTDEDGDVYLVPYRDDCLIDAGTTHKIVDGEKGMEMESVIYFLAEDGDRTFLFNPVYQTGDGRVYVTPSIGWRGNDGYTNIMEENTAVTVNGASEITYTKVTTRVESVLPAEKYVLVYMDENHRMLSSHEYMPDGVPLELTVPADTAYLLLETLIRNGDGELFAERQVIDRGNESMATFRARPDGICVKAYTYLTWR